MLNRTELEVSVDQVLIAAGGKGSRLSRRSNPSGSKVLIEQNGKTLFEYLIDSLIEGDAKEFIISTGYHTDRKIREIIKRKKIDAIVIPISECGSFRWIPYYVQDILDERFMFVCGHQPLDHKFIKEMFDVSQNSSYVASAYRGDLYKRERARKMKIFYDFQKKRIGLDQGKFDPKKLSAKFFIDSPYILTKDIVSEFSDNDGRGEYSSYILERWTNGESVSVVKSPTPPEFDYDEEFVRTIESLRAVPF